MTTNFKELQLAFSRERKWRHVKTGGIYEIVTTGLNEKDLTPVVIYRSTHDGSVWVRPKAEFLDGRFVCINDD